MPTADIKLEPNALAAATTTRNNLVVTAGPGAGKTELLAQRADFLLRTGQCRYPRRILAISFKVDAAKNLKERVRRRCPPELAARLDSHTFHAFAKRLIDAFRPVLTGVNALDPDYTIGKDRIPRRQIDFDSMAPLAATILESSAVARAALKQTYGFVFLDEFQDCTANQYDLVRAAFHGTHVELIAVGDAKQRIMRFAGALDGILKRFTIEFGATPLVLYLNFRAQPRLRRMQNAMIRVMEPSAALADDALTGEGGEVQVQRYPSGDDEARVLADRIQNWITVDGLPPDEVAVLVGKQVDLYTEALQAELRKRNISFRVENELQDLATEPIATLILDFLSVITGDREPDAYTRLMDVAAGWRGDDESSERHCAALRDTIDNARRRHRDDKQQNLRLLVTQFFEFLGEEVLLGLAPQYQQGQRLTELIEEVFTRLGQLHAKVGDIGQTLREFTGRDAVKLMTIHKAKGLEFENVIVLAVEEEMFWGKADDERSAYFVAISRAKRLLWLTTCDERTRPSDAPRNWSVSRRPHQEFLHYALSTQ